MIAHQSLRLRVKLWFQRNKPMMIGGFWSVLGYWLSPLSWWNDFWFNIPIAYAIAWVVDFFYSPAFMSSFILCYWATNLLGLWLIYFGVKRMGYQEKLAPFFTFKKIMLYLGIVLFYSALMFLFVKVEIITPHGDFLNFEPN